MIIFFTPEDKKDDKEEEESHTVATLLPLDSVALKSPGKKRDEKKGEHK